MKKEDDECLFSVWMVNYCSDYQEETYGFQKV